MVVCVCVVGLQRAMGANGVRMTLYEANDQDRLLKALCDQTKSSYRNTGDLTREK